MNKKPDIIISSFDADGIYKLIESLPRSGVCTKNLEDELERARIVHIEQLPPNVVTMNSKVKFLIKSTKKEFELILSYPEDIDKGTDKVSILAPIGSALIGLSIGDSIKWPKPDGRLIDIKIIDINYQPER